MLLSAFYTRMLINQARRQTGGGENNNYYFYIQYRKLHFYKKYRTPCHLWKHGLWRNWVVSGTSRANREKRETNYSAE